MSPGRVLFIGLLVTAGLLYVLNPGPEAFREFLTTEAAKRASGGEDSGVTDFLADRLGRRAGSLASDQFEREDYYLASVYTADLNGRIPGGEWTYLGIAGWFTPLEQPGDER